MPAYFIIIGATNVIPNENAQLAIVASGIPFSVNISPQ